MDQKLIVVDSVDQVQRQCKVVAVNNEEKSIRIHYINWKATHDENIPFDSPRIINDAEVHPDSENEDSFLDSDDGLSIGTSIGKLMRAVDGISRDIISQYDIRLTSEKSEKA